MSFTDKVVLITGASSGLGRASALRFAEEGAKVLAVGRDSDRLSELAAEHDAIHPLSADISTAENCQQLVRDSISLAGRLDALVNVAGVHRMQHSTDVTAEQWQQDIAINLAAPFFLSQAAIPHLLESQGNIVNVGSIASLQGQPYSATYCSAKHGLAGLTRALAMEFMKQDIRINMICPGGMDTPQVQNMSFPDDADFELVMRSAAPRGFMQAEDVAAAICFTASDEAKAIHGAVQVVDCGKTVG